MLVRGFGRPLRPLALGGAAVAVAALVGGESAAADVFASVVGALTYVATPTEMPTVAGLRAAGMGASPSLAPLLAGPALCGALGLDFELEKITDRDKITAAGFLVTPARMLDDEVEIAGKAPSADQLKAVLAG